MPTLNKRESDMQHRIAELKEQLAAAEASTAARAGLRDYLAKHPALTAADVAMVASEMRAPGRFKRATWNERPPKGLVGVALRKARAEKGWTGSEVAEKIGVHNASISGWERGAILPSEQYRAKIKRVLEVDVDALLKTAGNGAMPHQ